MAALLHAILRLGNCVGCVSITLPDIPPDAPAMGGRSPAAVRNKH